jgi:signal transduction histidine kinase
MFFGVVAFGRALRPLDNLRTDLIETRNGSQKRLAGRYPVEIQPLADELNMLLDHSERTVERTVMQAADLAHSLKTPLAVIANEASRMDMPLIQEQCRSMRRHVEHHLARARAAASGQSLGVRAEVRPVVDQLCRAMKTLYAERNLNCNVVTGPNDCFRGDGRDLQEMIGNLLDNACKWARSRIELNTATRGDCIQITIDDDGPGLKHDARETAFDRGARLDESTPGSGLGLAITRDLVLLHGGSILLEDSPLGGLRAILRLPALKSSNSMFKG